MWLTMGIGFWGLALIAHAIACRLPGPGNSVFPFLIVGSLTGFALIATLASHYGLSIQCAAGVLVYAFLCELYIFLFTLAISSVSANLLLNLSVRNMTQQEIDRRYDSSLMVTQRIERMLGTGLLEETPRGVQLTPRGLRLLRMFELARRFFRHDSASVK